MARFKNRRIAIAAASLFAVCFFIAAPLLLSTHHHRGEDLSGSCAICVHAFSSLATAESHPLHSSELFELGRIGSWGDAEVVSEPATDHSVRAPPLA